MAHRLNGCDGFLLISLFRLLTRPMKVFESRMKSKSVNIRRIRQIRVPLKSEKISEHPSHPSNPCAVNKKEWQRDSRNLSLSKSRNHSF